ncbi:hypothetical protein Gste01_00793 [Geobacillus stearothermophilus ATCC 7953]
MLHHLSALISARRSGPGQAAVFNIPPQCVEKKCSYKKTDVKAPAFLWPLGSPQRLKRHLCRMLLGFLFGAADTDAELLAV